MAEHIPHVLVVDDEEEIRKILSRILSRKVTRSLPPRTDNRRCRRLLDAPDAILMAHAGSNGMEVLKKIKEIDDNIPGVYYGLR